MKNLILFTFLFFVVSCKKQNNSTDYTSGMGNTRIWNGSYSSYGPGASSGFISDTFTVVTLSHFSVSVKGNVLSFDSINAQMARVFTFKDAGNSDVGATLLYYPTSNSMHYQYYDRFGAGGGYSESLDIP